MNTSVRRSKEPWWNPNTYLDICINTRKMQPVVKAYTTRHEDELSHGPRAAPRRRGQTWRDWAH